MTVETAFQTARSRARVLVNNANHAQRYRLYASGLSIALFAVMADVDRPAVSNYFAGRMRYVSGENKRKIKQKLQELGIVKPSVRRIRITPGRRVCSL